MRPSISLGHIANHMSRYACFALRIFKRIRLNATAVLFKAVRRMFNEFSIFPAKSDDLACDRVGKGNICTHVEAGPHVGPPPAPKTVARLATLGACQVWLQLSMLLLSSTTRANF